MANRFNPVKISTDIFNNITPDRGAFPHTSRASNFNRRNCSKPLASLESSPPPLKEVSPIYMKQMHASSVFRRSGSYDSPTKEVLNSIKTGF